MAMGMSISACRRIRLSNPGPVFRIACGKGCRLGWKVGGGISWKRPLAAELEGAQTKPENESDESRRNIKRPVKSYLTCWEYDCARLKDGEVLQPPATGISYGSQTM